MTKLQRQIVAHGTMGTLLWLVGRTDMAEMEVTKMMTAIIDRGVVADRKVVMS